MTAPHTDLTWRTIAEFRLPAAPDSAHIAATQVASAVRGLSLAPAPQGQLTSSVAEAVHKAVSHGRSLQVNWPVLVRVSVSSLTDPCTACCWGFFLISKTAEQSHKDDSPARHTIEVFLYQEREALLR